MNVNSWCIDDYICLRTLRYLWWIFAECLNGRHIGCASDLCVRFCVRLIKYGVCVKCCYYIDVISPGISHKYKL